MKGYTAAGQTVFDQMTALGDPTRCRLLLVLEQHDLTVGDLCAVVQLPQSTVSRHLKVLADDGWVTSHAEGTSRRYRASIDTAPERARRLWEVVREEMVVSAAAAEDARRTRSVLEHRRSRSQEFFSTAAGQWDRVRDDLFGMRADTIALLGLLNPEWTIGDLGCGTGRVAHMLAPFVRAVVAVDESESMLAAARERLASHENVTLEQGDLASLPLADGSLDAVVVSLVLHYVLDPERVLREAARVLRPGGRLLLVDMMPHDRVDLQESMGHVWRGFAEDMIHGVMQGAGFERSRYVPLAADPEAKGPALFAATGQKKGRKQSGSQHQSQTSTRPRARMPRASSRA